MTPLKDLGAIGWVADQEGYELPPNALTSVRNIRFRAGFAERTSGNAQVFSNTSVVPYGVFAYSNATANYVIHAGLTAVYADDGSTRTDITGTAPTGTATDKWTGGTLSGIFVLNNGKDVPMYWDGNTANNLATLTDWTATERCYTLRPFREFLVALRITKGSTVYPHMVKWSHPAEPGTLPTSWNESDPALDAGEQDAAETPDLLIDAMPLGDVLVLYKQRSMFGMQFIGAPKIFRFFRLPGDYGMLARNCGAVTPKGHVVLGQGDVYIHNGQGPQSILDNRARKWLFENMDEANGERSFVVANPARQEVWVCFPEVGQTSCTKALIWNWDDNTLTQRDLPNLTSGATGIVAYSTSTSTWATVSGSWDSQTGAWSDGADININTARIFGASTTSKIFALDSGLTFGGSAFTASIERTGLHFEEPMLRKLCKGVWPKIDGQTGTSLTITMGASETPEGAITWASPVTYTIGSTLKCDTFVTGRYLAYKVSSTDSAAWRIRSLDFDIKTVGAY